MYRQILDPVVHSLGWSSLVAAIPLILLFVMLGVLRVTAWMTSLVSLAVALVIAIVVYGMPVGQAMLAGTEGAAFGFFPILWIVINAIWVYQMTVGPATSMCSGVRSPRSATTSVSRRSSSRSRSGP